MGRYGTEPSESPELWSRITRRTTALRPGTRRNWPGSLGSLDG